MFSERSNIPNLNLISAVLAFFLCTSVLDLLLINGEGSTNVTNENTNSTMDKDFEDYVITFSRSGGIWGFNTNILYNSTNNHLLSEISNHFRISDKQLTENQQINLSKLISDANFFNLSFINDKPDCCDLFYYKLKVASGDKINTLRWTSANLGSSFPEFSKIPLTVPKIVHTLEEFTSNSTVLFKDSRCPNNIGHCILS